MTSRFRIAVSVSLSLAWIVSVLLTPRACWAGNAVAAAADKPAATKTALTRTKALKDNLKDFRLTLNYFGKEDKPFYRLTLLNPNESARRKVGKESPFRPTVKVDDALAGKIIDHLAAGGFLEEARAWDLRRRSSESCRRAPAIA